MKKENINLLLKTDWKQFKANRSTILSLEMYKVVSPKQIKAAKRLLTFLNKFKKEEQLMKYFNFDKNQLEHQLSILRKFHKESFMLNDSEYKWIDGLFLEGLGAILDFIEDETDLLPKEVEPEPEFVNGFRSWMETHHEVVSAITVILCKRKPTGIVAETQEQGGSVALYDLAKSLTNEFEKLNEGLEWGMTEDFMESVEEFLKKKLK